MRRSPSEADAPGGRHTGRRGVLALLFLLPLFPHALSGQATQPSSGVQPEDVGVSQVECCQTLLLPVGARMVALGHAVGARTTADAVFTNPAGLAGLEERHFVLHTAELPGATEDFSSQMLAATLLFTPDRIGTAGVSYRIMDFGQQPCVDEQGFTRGSLTLRHHVLLASFATDVREDLRAGLNYKVYTERLGASGGCEAEGVSARTQGVDLGLQYAPGRVPHLALGAALTDLGFALQAENAAQADPMPLRLRLSGSYEVLHHFHSDSSAAGWLSAELSLPRPEHGEVAVSIGAELAFEEIVQLRGGWRSGEGLGTGPALGLGLRYRNFTIAVGRSFQSSPLAGDDPPLDATFGVRF